MYIGDVSTKGLHHLVYEIVDNSIDEAMAGYATEIEVSIGEGEIITVTDNGRGFKPDEVGEGSMGLKSMRERAEELGGWLTITSAPGAGTKLVVTLKTGE